MRNLAVIIALLMLLFLACCKTEDATVSDVNIISPSSPQEISLEGLPEPFSLNDILEVTSSLETVGNWINAGGRDSVGAKILEDKAIIHIGMSASSASIVVSIPEDSEWLIDEDVKNGYNVSYVPDSHLALPVERVEWIDFESFDEIDLPLPRGGKIGDTMDDIKAGYLNVGSSYDPGLLYDISAIYPGIDPAVGDCRAKAGLWEQAIVGGYQYFKPSSNPNVHGTNIIQYVWVSSPNKEDWQKYHQLEYFFDEDGILYACYYSCWTDAE